MGIENELSRSSLPKRQSRSRRTYLLPYTNPYRLVSRTFVPACMVRDGISNDHGIVHSISRLLSGSGLVYAVRRGLFERDTTVNESEKRQRRRKYW